MKHSSLRIAGTALCLAFVLSGCGSASSASSAAASASASAAVPTEEPAASALTDTFKASDQYDYTGFDYSSGIDMTGMWTGVTAADYVTLPEDYQSIPIPQDQVTPSADDIASTVNSIVEQYAAAADGDTVNIDYIGTVNGIEFQGGNTNGQGADLTLGSGAYIEGFEDQIIGHKVGESFDIDVTFPDGYQDSADADGNVIVLSNTPAVFHVTLNSITYSWEPTDEWVAANLNTDPYNVSTVADLNNYVSTNLLQTNEENFVISYLVTNSTFADPLPEPILDYTVCNYLSFYNDYAEYYGMSLAEYFSAFSYGSIDAALADHESAIVDAAKSSLVQQAVAEAQGLTVTDDERTTYSEYVEGYGDAYVAQFALDRQVKAWLLSHAKIS